jgi:hypothetical protein
MDPLVAVQGYLMGKNSKMSSSKTISELAKVKNGLWNTNTVSKRL